LNEFSLDEEERHGIKIIIKNTQQSLRRCPVGATKKGAIDILFNVAPDFIVFGTIPSIIWIKGLPKTILKASLGLL